jgi:hypothetical protein
MPYRYREKVTFHPLVQFLYIVLLAVFVVSILEGGRSSTSIGEALLVGLALVGMALIFGRLLIELDEEKLTMTWGYLGWPKKKIPLAIVGKSEIISYRPIRQFGGWGIRCGRVDGEITGCYSMRGNRGVLLSLTTEIRAGLAKTRRFLVGSQKPEKLLQALEAQHYQSDSIGDTASASISMSI